MIDNSLLKSNHLCSDTWSGIEVWGNSAAHQYPVNGHYAQGYVELKNGATIENAECALALWRPNHWSTTGGIVHATDATFRNCAKAVHALHYANHHPATGKETAYNSRFRNCTFAIDNGYLGTTAFHKHADLNHVDGIGFIGCDFSADRTAANVSPWPPSCRKATSPTPWLWPDRCPSSTGCKTAASTNMTTTRCPSAQPRRRSPSPTPLVWR